LGQTVRNSRRFCPKPSRICLFFFFLNYNYNYYFNIIIVLIFIFMSGGRKSAPILPEIHRRDVPPVLLRSLPVSFGFHRSFFGFSGHCRKSIGQTQESQNRGKILHKSNNLSQSKPKIEEKSFTNQTIIHNPNPRITIQTQYNTKLMQI
jgi:hypothetical protein